MPPALRAHAHKHGRNWIDWRWCLNVDALKRPFTAKSGNFVLRMVHRSHKSPKFMLNLMRFGIYSLQLCKAYAVSPLTSSLWHQFPNPSIFQTHAMQQVGKKSDSQDQVWWKPLRKKINKGMLLFKSPLTMRRKVRKFNSSIIWATCDSRVFSTELPRRTYVTCLVRP